MPILNYTTSINFEKTIGEITKCLTAHGANKVIVDYEASIPVSITFCLMIKGNMCAFTLPCNYMGVLRALENSRNVPRNLKTKDQALRVSWRIIKDWTEAQMAIVEAQLAEISEVFLPYAITKSGQTVYQEVMSGNSGLMLNSGNQ